MHYSSDVPTSEYLLRQFCEMQFGQILRMHIKFNDFMEKSKSRLFLRTARKFTDGWQPFVCM